MLEIAVEKFIDAAKSKTITDITKITHEIYFLNISANLKIILQLKSRNQNTMLDRFGNYSLRECS